MPTQVIRVVRTLRAAGCVFAEDEARLLVDASGSPAELDEMVARRESGVPLEHILGWALFCGLRIAVQPGVFVPRHRSELLVREAVTALASEITHSPRVVVDLCCGSGAIGAAVFAEVGATSGERTIELHAADIDPVAVRCAAGNLAAVGGLVHQGDLYDALPAHLRGRIDVLVANTPYVPTDEIRLMPPEARLHESREALDGGRDGLDVQRRVVAAAADWLAPGGRLLVETSERQATDAAVVFARAGLSARTVTDDELGATVVLGDVTPTLRPRPDRARM